MDTKDKVKKCRKEKKLTQKQLGELSGLSEITIRKLEAGKSNPKIETLQKIADGLNVRLSDITDDSFTKYLLGNRKDAFSKDNDALIALRDELNLPLEYLSNATGIDVERLKQFEADKEKPTEIELNKIFNVLELNGLNSYDVFINKYSDLKWWVTRKERLLSYFDLLNEAGQAEAIRDIEKLTKIPEYKK